MIVSGFTFVRNAISLGYPAIESIKSLLPLCDELIVNVGKSSDNTLQLVQGIGDKKLKIVENVWDETNRKMGSELARQTDIALAQCSGRWCIYLQADEVIHESDYIKIRDSMNDYDDVYNVEGLLFDYVHFYGSYDTCHLDSPSFYRREIRAFKNHLGVASYGDAQGFRRAGRKLKVVRLGAKIYHYGWARPPEVMALKQNKLDRLWHDDKWLEANRKNADGIYNKLMGLRKFDGSHPAACANWVRNQKWEFSPPKKAIHPGGVKELKFKISRWLKNRGVGEYRGYRLVAHRTARPIKIPFRTVCLIRVRSIGDTILTTPVFREIKKAYPACRTTLIIEKKCESIVKNNPYIDEILIYQKGLKSLNVLWRLYRRKFDVSIDFLGNMRTVIITLLAGATCKIGLNERGRWIAYTHRILCRPYDYVGGQNLEYLRPLGILSTRHLPELFPSEEQESCAGKFISENNFNKARLIGLFPTGAWGTKKWPEKYYIELGRKIVGCLEMDILIFWGPMERKSATKIQAGIGDHAMLIPKTDFPTTFSLFKCCLAAVGNDSAFSHLAVASGISTITIFGPTHPGNWSPPSTERHRVVTADVDCLVCHKQQCETNICMTTLKPESVFACLVDMIKR